jgi:hypothetical protein
MNDGACGEQVPDNKVALTSAAQALEVGFNAGKKLRELGAKAEHLASNVQIERGEYARSEFCNAWELGFRRGHLGINDAGVLPRDGSLCDFP